jgi:hypothetical protein
MSAGQRPSLDKEILLSQIDARQIRRWRRARRRKEFARLVLWAIGTFAFLYLALWILFGH